MPHLFTDLQQKAKTFSLLNLIQIGKRLPICRHQQPAVHRHRPDIRVVRADLTICYQGQSLSVAHLPSVCIGDKVAVHPSVNGLVLVPLL